MNPLRRLRRKKLPLDGAIPGIEYPRSHGHYADAPVPSAPTPMDQGIYDPGPMRYLFPDTSYEPYTAQHDIGNGQSVPHQISGVGHRSPHFLPRASVLSFDQFCPPHTDPVVAPDEPVQQPLNPQMSPEIQNVIDDVTNLDTFRYDEPALYPRVRELEERPADANQFGPVKSVWPVDNDGQPIMPDTSDLSPQEPMELTYEQDHQLATMDDPYAQQIEALEAVVEDAYQQMQMQYDAQMQMMMDPYPSPDDMFGPLTPPGFGGPMGPGPMGPGM